MWPSNQFSNLSSKKPSSGGKDFPNCTLHPDISMQILKYYSVDIY